jgi:hypothetical protein
MGNLVTGNWWKLDTVGVVTVHPVHVVKMTWDSPATSGDKLLIKNGNGDIVWELTAIAGGTGITYPNALDLPVHGFNLVTLGSGTVYVVIKAS